jgi:hypothetical protein
MAPEDSGPPRAPRLSALPSPRARLLAFLAIILAGVAGAAIGYGVVDVSCTKDCTTATGVGAVAGALIAAAGVAVVAVLVLRAMGEWRTIQETRRDSDT